VGVRGRHAGEMTKKGGRKKGEGSRRGKAGKGKEGEGRCALDGGFCGRPVRNGTPTAGCKVGNRERQEIIEQVRSFQARLVRYSAGSIPLYHSDGLTRT